MKTCIQYLDLAKQITKASDYALAKHHLGLTHAAISHLRKDPSKTYSDQTALKVAEIIGEDPAVVLLDVQAQRAASDAERKVWLRLRNQLKKAGKQAACVLAFGAAIGSVHVADVAHASPALSGSDTLCIMLSLLSALILLSRRTPARPAFPGYSVI